MSMSEFVWSSLRSHFSHGIRRPHSYTSTVNWTESIASVGTVVPRLRSAVRLGGVQSRRRYYAAEVAPGELPAVDRVSALERRVAMLEAAIAAMGRE